MLNVGTGCILPRKKKVDRNTQRNKKVFPRLTIGE